MMNMPSSEELDRIFQDFKTILTHPEFQNALREQQSAPSGPTAPNAQKTLSTQSLAARGVPISPGMHISHVDGGAEAGAGLTQAKPVQGQILAADPICIMIGNLKICANIEPRVKPILDL